MIASIKKYNKYCLLCSQGRFDLFYYNGIICVYDKTNRRVVSRHRIDNCYFFSFLSRLLRKKPRAAVALDNNTFIFSCHGKVYRLSIIESELVIEHEFLKGMNNPLSFCTRYDKNGNIIDILYGEYINNFSHEAVSVYRRFSNGWKNVYDFPAHTVKHIHNIIYDKYRNRYLIMTGDSDDESGIWEADPDFNSVSPIVRGSQKYRACVLMPTKDGFFYVTDTPIEQNYVYHLDNDGNLTAINEILGPCIFGIEKNDYLYFATSVEGDSTLATWKYIFSSKLGNGVKDRYSHLYRLSKNGELEEIDKIEKDWLPMWLFEFGNIKFPSSNDNRVYICPQSLVKEGTYYVNLENQAD